MSFNHSPLCFIPQHEGFINQFLEVTKKITHILDTTINGVKLKDVFILTKDSLSEKERINKIMIAPNKGVLYFKDIKMGLDWKLNK